MAGKLTTHALDTVRGCGARGLRVEVSRIAPDNTMFPSVILDANGRGILIAGADFAPGQYQLVFHIADYHLQHHADFTDSAFFPRAVVQFAIEESGTDCHLPLLFSPYSYSTYRGV